MRAWAGPRGGRTCEASRTHGAGGVRGQGCAYRGERREAISYNSLLTRRGLLSPRWPVAGGRQSQHQHSNISTWAFIYAHLHVR